MKIYLIEENMTSTIKLKKEAFSLFNEKYNF